MRNRQGTIRHLKFEMSMKNTWCIICIRRTSIPQTFTLPQQLFVFSPLFTNSTGINHSQVIIIFLFAQTHSHNLHGPCHFKHLSAKIFIISQFSSSSQPSFHLLMNIATTLKLQTVTCNISCCIHSTIGQDSTKYSSAINFQLHSNFDNFETY